MKTIKFNNKQELVKCIEILSEDGNKVIGNKRIMLYVLHLGWVNVFLNELYNKSLDVCYGFAEISDLTNVAYITFQDQN